MGADSAGREDDGGGGLQDEHAQQGAAMLNRIINFVGLMAALVAMLTIIGYLRVGCTLVWLFELARKMMDRCDRLSWKILYRVAEWGKDA